MFGDPVAPLALALRTYSYAYTASHDFAASARVMVDDYRLLMGPFEVNGRDAEYREATERQFSQYPGLGFTVLEVITNGDRAAMRFCEHGINSRSGAGAAWTGISLYEWDGERLTSCRVEQDYLSRTRQLETGRGDVVPSPAIDPWTTAAAAQSAVALEAARAWLRSDWLADTAVVFDDEDRAAPHRVQLSSATTTVLDIFSAADAVAFHVEVVGTVLGGPGLDSTMIGRSASLYATGLIRAGAAGEVRGHVVTDRLAFRRRLASIPTATTTENGSSR